MNLQKLQSKQGVSPVVGVILVVAIAVILSAVIGSFVLDLGQSVSNSGGNAEIGVSIAGTSDGGAEAQIVTGSADTLKVFVDGDEVANESNVKPGTKISIPPTEPDSKISFVSITDGEEKVITSKTLEGTSDSTVTFDASEITFTQA